MLKAPGYNSSLQPAITNTITANPQRSTLGLLYIKSTREEGGGGIGCTNASGGGGTF